MKLDDFDFDLPEELIATRPAKPRSSARLLHAVGDSFRNMHVHDLPDLLGPGDRLILNDTKVIPARLFGRRWRKQAQRFTSYSSLPCLGTPDGSRRNLFQRG